MFRMSLISFLALGVLAGCGSAGVMPAVDRAAKQQVGSSSLTASNALRFQAATIADLTTAWDTPRNTGRKIKFEGSFGPETYTVAYLVTNHGYKLWDHSGHGIRVANIFTQVRPGSGPDGKVTDPFRDFNNATRPRLLSYGNYVTIEGTFVAGYDTGSHGGSFRVPPSIDVWFINGKPTSDYVSK